MTRPMYVYSGEALPPGGQADRAGGVGGGEGVQQVAAQPPGQGLRLRPAKEGPQGVCVCVRARP